MESSVSPLPLPLWPVMALSLMLFAFTAVTVTVSGHYTRQLYANPNQNTVEVDAPSLATINSARSGRMF